MKNCKSVVSALGFVLVSIVATTAADRPPLTFTFGKANVPGALQTFPSGINNAGTTVGGYEDKNKVFHGYLLSGKKLTVVDDPNGTDSSVSNIQFNGCGRFLHQFQWCFGRIPA